MANELLYTLSDMPVTLIAESCVAAAPFVHQDRRLNCHVLLYIHSGEMEVVEEGTRYRLTPGSLLFLLAGAHHWGNVPCAPQTRWTYVHFTLPQTAGRSASPFRLPVRHQELTAEDYARTLRLPKLVGGLQVGSITEKLERMTTLFGSNLPLRAAYLTSVLTELLMDIYTCANPATVNANDPVSLAMRLIEANIYGNFDAGQIERTCGRSYNYLCGLFKEHTGMSPQGYHRRMQMSEAARLLRETQKTVSEISFVFGFCNPQYFSRVFTATYQVSPKRYRKRFWMP